ncbi:MAG TPA: LuxR C-terminal-related transcriptional regulator, partial [Longimicrobiales bacterium]|nr:LuxR C-terminal-related transcriptional regulator [Longimicrobiales bacterium]
LPADARLLVLAAAADPTGDPTLLGRATERLGLDAEAASPAVAAGLIEIGARVRFRHALARRVVYGAADADDRRAAHRALGEATDPSADPDRRAWHLAQAASAPDGPAAEALERALARARRRGGAAAVGAFLRRATVLTPEPGQRGVRALAAAAAMLDAGAPDAARELLGAAELCPLGPPARAQLERLRGRIAFVERRGGEAASLLIDAAAHMAPVDAERAREAYLEALDAAIVAGPPGDGAAIREVARVARLASSPPNGSRPADALLDGVVELLIEGGPAGLPRLKHALERFRRERPSGQAERVRWLRLAPLAQKVAAHQLWDDEAWSELAERTVGIARRAGALGALPVALAYAAGVRVQAGDLAGAAVQIREADAIAAAARCAPMHHAALLLAAWRGNESAARDLLASTVRDAEARGEGAVLGAAGHATAVLHNGLSHFDVALASARAACEGDAFTFTGRALVELIEAAVRMGARALAADALERLAACARPADTDWALGLLARSGALLESGHRAGALYGEAIVRLGRTRQAAELARAHLLYGEWLRRESRRTDARDHLRVAHHMLERFGAGAFAERARRELAATGENVHRRSASAHGTLTAQEARVADLAARGFTNAEIGSRLFISARTAEYHLRKVYAKLGVHSRRRLRDHLEIAGPPVAPSWSATRRGPVISTDATASRHPRP